MTIVLTGGGSGGHITPILAVAAELKRTDPSIKVVYIGQKGDGLADIPAGDPNIDEVYGVRAGKLRRYHGEGLKQLLDVQTMALNIRDLFWIGAGMMQSYILMGKLKPQFVFTRGGYVSVPVALAGKLRGVPYMTHDSDSTPSLANRLIARWAELHAVALPEEEYPYPIDKTKMTGIPVSSSYKPVSAAAEKAAKLELGLPPEAQLLLVTGGGNGAAKLNRFVIDNAGYLLKKHSSLRIVHLTGRPLYEQTKEAYGKALDKTERKRVHIKDFVTDLHRYSAAADVIIARGGATNLAEFAIQAKACIVIPPPQLIWAVKNTEVLAGRNAVIMLTEDQAVQERRLAITVAELLDQPARRQELARTLATYARPQAAHNLAKLILELAV